MQAAAGPGRRRMSLAGALLVEHGEELGRLRAVLTMHFINTVEIERPIEEVFAYLAHFENVPRWNYAIQETRKSRWPGRRGDDLPADPQSSPTGATRSSRSPLLTRPPARD
jgi:hypothetical protein